jgi:hypothetical protein
VRSARRTPYSRQLAHLSDRRRAVAHQHRRCSEPHSRTRPASDQEPVDESPFYPRCRDVGADGGTVDAVVTSVRHHFGQGDQHDLPGAGLAQEPEPPIDRVPLAVLPRHFAPGRPAARPPENTVQNRSVLGRAPSATTHRWFDRQQILQNPPLRFAQIAPAQSRLQRKALNQPLDPASINSSTPPSSLQSLRPQDWLIRTVPANEAP